MRKTQNWLPRKVKGKGGLKKGTLSKQLGIPEEKNIPLGLLADIKQTPIGWTVHNRHGIGKPRIKVTLLLKKRAVLAHTMKLWRG